MKYVGNLGYIMKNLVIWALYKSASRASYNGTEETAMDWTLN
jgi:hypothetical protein